MIAQLKSKKEVLIDPFKKISGKPIVEVIDLNKTGDGYSFNVRYYYNQETEDGEGGLVSREVNIQSMSPYFSNAEIDGLHQALNLNATGTFSEQDTKEVIAGLRYIVANEKRWDLTINDWE